MRKIDVQNILELKKETLQYKVERLLKIILGADLSNFWMTMPTTEKKKGKQYPEHVVKAAVMVPDCVSESISSKLIDSKLLFLELNLNL